MKKWEEQNNKRLHQKKVQTAKPTIKTPVKNLSDSKSSSGLPSQLPSNFFQSPQRSSTNYNDVSQSSQGSQISDFYEFEKQDPTLIPLFKLLKHYGLQQYTKVRYLFRAQSLT